MGKMKRARNPKGMGSYRILPNGTHQWRLRKDGEETTLTADTPSELQQKVSEVIDLKITKSKLKVDEWFTQWLKYIDALRKPATYNQYYFIYNTHIKPEIGSKKLISIKSNDIQNVILEMNKKGLSTWTMKHARKVMSGAFGKAYKDKLIPVNPVIEIEIPKKQAKPRKTLNTAELAALFRQLEKSRWIWSAKFMLVTGVRRGELLALQWSDIDDINKRITIDESDSSTGLDDTKSSKVHYVPLSDKAKYYLAMQKEMLYKEDNPILVSDKLKATDLIFPNKYGEMLNPNSYFTLFYRAAEKAGIKASPHCLRHTFVYLNRKTLSLKEIQEILGHDESTTTLDIYGDMINDSIDKTAKQIDDVFTSLDKEIEKIKENTGKVVEFKKRAK
jgi:integrase